MAFDWNVFRILADVSHTLSKVILIWAIHSNKSAEGVSLITQVFYLVVFVARYIPHSWYASGFHGVWNTTLKIFYLLSSAYIIFIMTRVYARTREREKAWRMAAYIITASLIGSPLVMLALESKSLWSFSEFCWVFSLVLESVCVLPQLLLLRQTTVPTVIDSFYLVCLGSYRGFYLINWLIRAIREQYFDPISVIFGLVQTLLYLDFAWVYWTRQRVKLRGGTVIDSDDMSKGWFVSRLNKYHNPDDDDVENSQGGDGAASTRSGRSWGARGISVSADDGVHEASRESLADPDEFEDRTSEDGKKQTPANGAGSGSGSEWREEGPK